MAYLISNIHLTFRSFDVKGRSYKTKQSSIKVHHPIFGQRHVHGDQALRKRADQIVVL